MAPGDIFNLTGATPPFPDSGPGVAEVGGGLDRGVVHAEAQIGPA